MVKFHKGLSVAVRSNETKAQEEIRHQLQKLSEAEVRKLFMGLPRGSGKTAAASATSAFIGLRAALGTVSPAHADPWKFGTVHRNKVTDELVMAVGHRQVISLKPDRRVLPVDSDPVEDWFDYWEVEQDT